MQQDRNEQRFDDLTRALAAGATRRQALRTLGVGIATATLSALFPRIAGAQPKTKTIRCKVREEGFSPDGEKVKDIHCEVECGEGAGYCAVCGIKKEEDGGIACAAACCSSDDPEQCVPPDKRTTQLQCQQGRVKIYK